MSAPTLSVPFDPLAPAQRENPFDVLAAARSEQPVFYVPRADSPDRLPTTGRNYLQPQSPRSLENYTQI